MAASTSSQHGILALPGNIVVPSGNRLLAFGRSASIFGSKHFTGAIRSQLEAAGMTGPQQPQLPTPRVPHCLTLPNFMAIGPQHLQRTGQGASVNANEYGLTSKNEVLISGIALEEGTTIEQARQLLQEAYPGSSTSFVAGMAGSRTLAANPLVAAISFADGLEAWKVLLYYVKPTLPIIVFSGGSRSRADQGHPLQERLYPNPPVRGGKEAKEAERRSRTLRVRSAALAGADAAVHMKELASAVADASAANPGNEPLQALSTALEVRSVRRVGGEAWVELTLPAAVAALLEMGWLEWRGNRYTFHALAGGQQTEADAYAVLLGPFPLAIEVAVLTTWLQDLARQLKGTFHPFPTGLLYEWLSSREGSDYSRIKARCASAVFKEAILLSKALHFGTTTIAADSAVESEMGRTQRGSADDSLLIRAATKQGASYAAVAMQRPSAGGSGGAAVGSGEFAALTNKLSQVHTLLQSVHGNVGAIRDSSVEQVQLQRQNNDMTAQLVTAGQQQAQQLSTLPEALQQLQAGQERLQAGQQQLQQGQTMVTDVLEAVVEAATDAKAAAIDAKAAATGAQAEAAAVRENFSRLRSLLQRARGKPSPGSATRAAKSLRRTPEGHGAEGGDLSSAIAAAAEEESGDEVMAQAANENVAAN